MVLAEAAAVAALLVASVEDMRRREVSERCYAACLAGVVAAKLLDIVAGHSLYYGPLPLSLYIVLDVFMLGAGAVLALLKLYGWGDVAFMLLIAVASPGAPRPGSVLPALLLSLLYSGAATAAIAVYNAAVNLALHRRLLSRVPPRLRLYYLVAARPVRAEKLAARPGWRYPLSLCGRYKTRFDIYKNPEDIAREVRDAIRRGCITPRDYVWTSYGLPGIPLLALGYAAALAAGDPLELTPTMTGG